HLKWSEKINPSEVKSSENGSFERFYAVRGKRTDQVREGDLVEVHLIAHAPYPKGLKNVPSLKITDILPSGLTPITSAYTHPSHRTDGLNHPYRIDGQEVNCMWIPEFKGRLNPDETQEGSHKERVEIRYLARVIHPGKFYADPARMESFEASEEASFSKE